jgi:hypothetical protein
MDTVFRIFPKKGQNGDTSPGFAVLYSRLLALSHEEESLEKEENPTKNMDFRGVS